MKSEVRSLACASCALILTALPAFGQSLSVTGPFLQWYNEGPNNLSFPVGDFVRPGAEDVVPNGFASPPTVGIASTTNVSTGAPISLTLYPLTSAVTPNFFRFPYPICTTNCSPTANNNPANLTGPWTLSFSNSGINGGVP
jgi:hypothetical protein